MMRHVGLLLAALLATVGDGRAQVVATRSLDSATVVRLHLTSGRVEKGKLLASFGPDSSRLRYCLYPAPPCAVGDARYVERSASEVSSLATRRATHAGRGALIGAVLGLGVGFIGVNFAEYGYERELSTGEVAKILIPTMFIFGGLGATIGAGIDVWSPPEPLPGAP